MRDPQHPLHIVVAGYRSFGHRFIDVGFHYQTDCDVDRQARGRLTDFTTWTAVADTAADDTIVAAAAGQGQSVRGNSDASIRCSLALEVLEHMPNPQLF